MRRLADRMRARDLRMIHEANMGHAGGDMSAFDILTVLYFNVLDIDPENPDDPARDRFILSKGHSSGALYTALAYAGFFPIDELETFMSDQSRLNGHPDCNKIPGVETSTGPLGHGLPVAVGAAIGAKISHASWRTFVLTGDGELQEGSNWEAAMSAGHRQLDNLSVIIDRNRLQQGFSTAETVKLEPLADKWRAFGWEVTELDGHDYRGMIDVFNSVPLRTCKPTCIIAHTHKGQGVSFMKDQVGWHHRVPNAQELAKATRELGEVK